MQITRLCSISVIYQLKEHLHNNGFTTEAAYSSAFPFVKVLTKDQAYTQLDPECIVVYPSNQFDQGLQIGGGYWIRTLYNFDIYANSDGKLSDLVDLVRIYLETDSNILRYDQHAPTYQVSDGLVRTIYPDGTPAQVCQMSFENRTVTFLDRVTTIGEATAHSAQMTSVISIPNN